MKCAGYWGQELRADTVEFHCNRWQPVKDPDTFDGRRVLCSSTWLVRIEIDANYFTCAVRDCLWRLDMSLGMGRGGCTPPETQLLLRGVHPPPPGFGMLLLLRRGVTPFRHRTQVILN